MKRAAAVVFFSAALAACGSPKDAATTPAAPAAVTGEVFASDEYGAFDAEIADIAFWTHPSLPFQGLVIASTTSGVAAFNIEDGAEVARLDAAPADGLEVVYAGTGASARGVLIVGETAGKAYRFFAIDNDARSLTPLPASGAENAGGAAFCAGPDRDGALRLVELRGRSVGLAALTVEDAGVAVGEATTRTAPEETVACVVDPLDGAVYLAGKSGAIFRMSASGDIDADRFAMLKLGNVASIGLALNGLVEGGATGECCGEIAILDAADATIHLVDRDDGKVLGAVRITSSFDVEAVVSTTAMGVGYGNFGGIYRAGVLALATDGEHPTLRLAPLNGAMDAISAPLGPTAEPRGLASQPEAEDAPVIDVELVTE